ncbi:MAG: MBL fold metallo-hydrolase [Candidatus Muiribacteriota bacterium]
MKICIHRGTNEIGGNCIELESQGKRLIIDLGIPLNAEKDLAQYLPEIEGLKEYCEDLSGILISHIHQDHIGLIPYINPKTPLYMGKDSQSILKKASKFQFNKFDYNQLNLNKFENKKSFNIGPFIITPFLMDHSAYDSYSLLIECDGKRFFYSGDFRNTGRKSRLIEELFNENLKNIDCMLIEGTTISKNSSHNSSFTEKDVENEMIKEFKKSKGLVFVQASSQNIDRIVSIYRACLRSSRHLVYDLYTSLIMEATNNRKLPQSDYDNVDLFIPQIQRVQIKNNKWFDDLANHSAKRIFMEDIKNNPEKYVILFRGIHLRDFKKQIELLENSKYIYSLWEGYFEEDNFKSIREFLNKNEIQKISIHSSGHADRSLIEQVIKKMNPLKIIPVHTENKEIFKEISENVYVADDREWIEI